METAALSDVTPAMMDEAAHRAAEAVEAAADPSVVPAGRVDEEHAGEPARPPTPDPVAFAPSENHAHLEDPSVASEAELAETMPVPALSPDDATAMSALVAGTAASIDAEVAAVGDATASLADETAPPADVSTPKDEAAERTDDSLRWDLYSPVEVIGAYGTQVVDMLAANMAASSHFLTALMSATSVTDVMAVNTNHLRRQMELMATQRRQLTALARTIAFDALKPFSTLPADRSRDR